MIVCPHCGHESHHCDFDYTTGGEFDCSKCGKWFDLEVETVPYFTTSKLCSPEDHKWEEKNRYPDIDMVFKSKERVDYKCAKCGKTKVEFE
jgi:DNA-directed RNA polymerase subunit RPC12/RpoP